MIQCPASVDVCFIRDEQGVQRLHIGLILGMVRGEMEDPTMGTDNDRDRQSQSQQGQSQSQSHKPDDLTKDPREHDEVGGPGDHQVERNPDQDREDHERGDGGAYVGDADRDLEDHPDSPIDRLQDHDKIEGRDRIEELKRQQRDQTG